MPYIHADFALKLVYPASAEGEFAEAFTFLPHINLFRVVANAETMFPPFIRVSRAALPAARPRQGDGAQD